MANYTDNPHTPVDLDDPSSQTPILVGDGGLSLRLDETASDIGDDGTQTTVAARGYWEGIWRRLKKDKLALAGGVFIIVLFVVAFAGAPIAAHVLGHGPNEPFIASGGLDSNLIPVGPWSHVGAFTPSGSIQTQLLPLGADSSLARDEFLRVLYGAQPSLEVGMGATFLVIILGVFFGAIAGFYGGWSDTLISRAIEVTMAFPYLLFVIALAGVFGDTLNNITFGFLGQGVVTLVLIFGLLGWFYTARVFRSVVLSLREKEFVEAARMVGASNSRIIRSHILPHLVGPIIVLATLSVAAFILAEAGLSFLGIGIRPPTSSWGSLLAVAPQYYTAQPLLMVWPGLALIATTLAFNLLGDGLRDAFDPRASR
jgi:peptide/nickel transport system permease protein